MSLNVNLNAKRATRLLAVRVVRGALDGSGTDRETRREEIGTAKNTKENACAGELTARRLAIPESWRSWEPTKTCGHVKRSRWLSHRQNDCQVLMNPHSKFRNKNVDAGRHQEKERYIFNGRKAVAAAHSLLALGFREPGLVVEIGDPFISSGIALRLQEEGCNPHSIRGLGITKRAFCSAVWNYRADAKEIHVGIRARAVTVQACGERNPMT